MRNQQRRSVFTTDNKKTKKKTKKKTFFQKLKTTIPFEREIYSGVFTLNDSFKKQIHVKIAIDKFNESTKLKSADRYFKGKQKSLDSF